MAEASNIEQELYDLKKALLTYFRNHSPPLIPIFSPRDQQVGDIYHQSSSEHVAPPKKCFPKLPAAKEVFTTLPKAIDVSGGSAAAYLSLKRLFSGQAAASRQRRMIVSFEKPTYEGLPAAVIRDAWDKKACPELSPYLKGGLIPPNARQNVPLLIIGGVYRARVTAVLTLGSEASANAMIDAIATGGADVGVTAELKRDNTAMLISKKHLPVAISPAFIPVKDRGIMLGGGASEQGAIEWVEYDAEIRPSQVNFIKHYLDEQLLALG
jgi:hypothetical protein